MTERPVVRRIAMVVLVTVAASGCAQKERQRITLLEGANANLTERLNLTRGELETVNQQRDDLERRLASAHDDLNGLQTQLAQQPTPEQAAPGWTPVPGGAMIAIDDSILFVSGRVTVREEARRTLDGIASTLKGEYAGQDVLVFGHTDTQPIKKSGWSDNYQLSAERALAVVRYLRDRGLPPERLIACGCGAHRPRASNASPAGRAANRRVEVYAIDPGLLAVER